MKKYAIVTLYGEINYGNRLQNYAIIRYFEKQGIRAETVVRRQLICFTKKARNILKRILVKFFKNYFKEHDISSLRYETFRQFTHKKIPTRFYTGSVPKRFFDEYDLFVVGSDQVWNPCFSNYEKQFDEMFLAEVPNDKKACFAPSFGVSKIPEQWRHKFADALHTFPSLCAREQSGVEIIQELTGKTAKVMIDPTLMLDADEWLQIATPVNNLSDKFILDYFLGDVPDDASYCQAVEQEQGFERVRLLDLSNPDIYVSGPAEFLYLISKASLVCTDSFHACVFSILFNKPFAIFKRKGTEGDMFSRLHTLLKMFGVNTDGLKSGEIIHIDAHLRDEVLAAKRKEVQMYFHLN